jgi:hypothetical protein
LGLLAAEGQAGEPKADQLGKNPRYFAVRTELHRSAINEQR